MKLRINLFGTGGSGSFFAEKDRWRSPWQMKRKIAGEARIPQNNQKKLAGGARHLKDSLLVASNKEEAPARDNK